MIRVNGRTGAARARSDSSRSKAIGRTPRLIQINTQTWLRLKLGWLPVPTAASCKGVSMR